MKPCRNHDVGSKEDTCKLCWLWRHDVFYNRAMGGDGQVDAKPIAVWHQLKAATEPGILQQAKSFAGSLIRHALAGFPHVSAAEQERRLSICQACQEYTERGTCRKCKCPLKRKASWSLETCPLGKWQPSPVQVRHLIYHCYPAKHGTFWTGLDALLDRFEVFNGLRVIAVVTGPDCVPAAQVQDHVRQRVGDTVHWIVKPNVRTLGEVNTWHDLMRSVQTTKPGHATFYAHSKGASRPPEENGYSSHWWGRMMLEVNLDYLPLVEESLGKYPMTGAFKARGQIRDIPGERDVPWHYAGSFYWFRNRDVFSQPDWDQITMGWAGTEYWPARVCGKGNAGVLFCDRRQRRMNLYSLDWLGEEIEPDLIEWRARHADKKGMGICEGRRTFDAIRHQEVRKAHART